jgi:hypothetical protein
MHSSDFTINTMNSNLLEGSDRLPEARYAAAILKPMILPEAQYNGTVTLREQAVSQVARASKPACL